MRILIISPFPPPVHGHSLAGKMAYEGLKQTNEVTIIDSALDKNFSGNKLPPIYSPNRIWKILVTLVRDSRIFFSQHYDIVYMGIGISFRGFMRYAPYMVMAMMKNEPYVLHTHGSTFRAMYDSVGEWKRFVLRFLLKRAAGVIVLGNSLRSMFEGIVSEGEIYVCENGVENTRVYWPSEPDMQPQALEMLHKKEIDMVVNIPKNLTAGELDNGYKIRRAAIDLNIPLITNARLASAFINAFCTMTPDDLAIKSWEEYK